MAKTSTVVAVALFCAVAARSQSLQLSQTSLTFSGYAGGDAAAPQSIIVTSTTQTPVRFTVASDNSSWITVSPSKAVTPARISVSVDPSALAAAGYQTRILISDPTAAYGPIVVPVSFTVDTRPPVLDIVPDAVRLGERDLVDTVFVRNVGGGGRIPFRVSLLSQSDWVVSVNPDQGVAAPNAPVPVRVRVSADGLDPGCYRAVLRFASLSGSEDIPIAFFVGGAGAAIGAQPRGFEIDLRQGAPISLTRRVAIQNRGTGLLNWTADLVEGSQWVKLNTSSGLSTPLDPSFLTFSVENNGLAAGAYYALVRVSNPSARNTPLLIPIVLGVRDPAIPPRPDLSPAGLTFVAVAGQPPPPPQTVQIDANSSKTVAYQASGSTGDGLGWLPFSGAGIASGQRSGQTAIAVNHASLQPGVYTGEVAYSFSNNDASAIGVTLVVLPAGAKLAAATGCTPTRLTMTQSDLVSNFSIPAGWPAPLTIRLTDDCGSPILGGQVVLTFSNGDPALAMSLSDPRDGSYSATWVPTKNAASVSITARAAAVGLPQASAALTGAVFPNKAPILFEDATVNQFNAVKGAALAPGTMVTISGSGLAAATAPADGVPLPTNVNGTRVLVGGVEAPLFAVSDAEIRAQIPVELAANRQYQVLVSANGAFTVPDTIALTAAQPGLRVSSDDSRVVAQHSDSTAISASAPASPGEEIVVYLTGMGLTDPQVGSGAPAPTDSLARALAAPTVTVDGAPAEVVFAGLTPGAVGLYQINLRVPADARSGDLAVAITQGGAQSNSGVLAVRQIL